MRPGHRRMAGRSSRVHDSKESWERFRDEILMPRLSQGIEGGFTVPPEETTFSVHNQQSG